MTPTGPRQLVPRQLVPGLNSAASTCCSTSRINSFKKSRSSSRGSYQSASFFVFLLRGIGFSFPSLLWKNWRYHAPPTFFAEPSVHNL